MSARTQALKDTAQHIAGIVIGKLVLRPLGVRFNKSDRGTKWFSTVAANLAAEGVPLPLGLYLPSSKERDPA